MECAANAVRNVKIKRLTFTLKYGIYEPKIYNRTNHAKETCRAI